MIESITKQISDRITSPIHQTVRIELDRPVFANSTAVARQFTSVSRASTTYFEAAYNNAVGDNCVGFLLPEAFTIGHKYRLRFNVDRGLAGAVGLYLNTNNTGFYQNNTVDANVDEGWNDFEYTIPSAMYGIMFRVTGGNIPASGSLVISKFSAERIA